MPSWSMDDWMYVERQTIKDPSGRPWTVAVMDVLGQEGDPEVPSRLLESQYASGRYFTLIYAPGGGIQRESGHASLEAATREYGRLLSGVADGSIDPAQPEFKTGFEE